MANSDSQEAFVTGNGEELMLLSRAAGERGVSQNYLRFAIFNKKLLGVKIKGVWYTTRPWMDEYFRSIIPRKAKRTELSFGGTRRESFPQRGSSRVSGKLSSVRPEFIRRFRQKSKVRTWKPA